jgi:hypothetical protein
MTLALSVLGAAASFVGIYAFYWQFSTERKKLFAFEISYGFSVASASDVGGDYRLSVHFTPADGVEEEVEGAFVQFVRLANLGREPIYARDIAPANPLRVEVSGAQVLDISIADVHRSVNQVKLRDLNLTGSEGTAAISFDFLDYGDGALVRILTAGEATKVAIDGDVIGMPGGIVETSPRPSSTRVSNIGFGAFLLAELTLFGLIVLLFHHVLGTWKGVWLLALPFPAFVIPIILALLIGESGSMFRRSSWRRKGYPSFKYPSDFPYAGHLFDFSGMPVEVEPGRSPRPRS